MPHLEMKDRCEKCAQLLEPDGESYICSFECTFCAECAAQLNDVCPNCGGELARRPSRMIKTGAPSASRNFPLLTESVVWVFLISLAIWCFITVSATMSMYEFDRSIEKGVTIADEIKLPVVNFSIFALLTPFVFLLARRYPIRRKNWWRQVAFYTFGGICFASAHVLLRSLVYPVFDPGIKATTTVFWDSHTHVFGIKWMLLKRLFFYNSVDDFVSVYCPTICVAHAVWYYKNFREREMRASQLETQLTKARLKALKSQLQPHFLFNTMHSISALILTDTSAADKMITRLGDFLRISLDNEDLQFTALNREIEFVNGYLEIEKVRFEDRLSLCFDIASDSLDAQVPHLLLQPLVENAVRHGIARRTGGGKLGISAHKENGKLHIKIKDNGPGLTDTERERLRGGLGLRATRERLQTIYGDEQRFEIRSAVDGGVEVEMWIPFRAGLRLTQHDAEGSSQSAAD